MYWSDWSQGQWNRFGYRFWFDLEFYFQQLKSWGDPKTKFLRLYSSSVGPSMGPHQEVGGQRVEGGRRRAKVDGGRTEVFTPF